MQVELPQSAVRRKAHTQRRLTTTHGTVLNSKSNAFNRTQSNSEVLSAFTLNQPRHICCAGVTSLLSCQTNDRFSLQLAVILFPQAPPNKKELQIHRNGIARHMHHLQWMEKKTSVYKFINDKCINPKSTSFHKPSGLSFWTLDGRTTPSHAFEPGIGSEGPEGCKFEGARDLHQSLVILFSLRKSEMNSNCYSQLRYWMNGNAAFQPRLGWKSQKQRFRPQLNFQKLLKLAQADCLSVALR